jgi:hypothetical protein
LVLAAALGWGGPLPGRGGGRGAPAALAHHRSVAAGGGLMAFQERGSPLLLAAQVDQLGGRLVGHPHRRGRHGRLTASPSWVRV